MRTFVIGATGVVIVAILVFLLVGFLAPRDIVVQHRRFIAAEPTEVWKVISDYRAWPELFQYGDPEAAAVKKVEVVSEDSGGVGTTRAITFTDGSVWRDMVSVYEPPYNLRFSGEQTPGVTDWQNHILLEPGARGGTVATFRVSFSPAGFLPRVMTQLYYEAVIRHHAIDFLDGVAARLGVENTTVEQYVAAQRHQRARDAAEAARRAQEEAPAEGEGAATPEGTDAGTGAPAPTAPPQEASPN